ncbi:MAG: GDP-mannose 4,6-dehydratase [Patescibacteria group bacterium]
MDKILITGGAGYIGSHLLKDLLRANFSIIGLDNLSTGFIEPIEILKKEIGDFEFIRGDLADKNLLEKIFEENKIETVVHLAAKIDAAGPIGFKEKIELYKNARGYFFLKSLG